LLEVAGLEQLFSYLTFDFRILFGPRVKILTSIDLISMEIPSMTLSAKGYGGLVVFYRRSVNFRFPQISDTLAFFFFFTFFSCFSFFFLYTAVTANARIYESNLPFFLLFFLLFSALFFLLLLCQLLILSEGLSKDILKL
jgi:hypothetical protein